MADSKKYDWLGGLQKRGGPEARIGTQGGLIDAENAEVVQTFGRFVCQVLIDAPSGPQAAGTGFLVGPDLVLTNFHVIESIHVSKLECRFDLISQGPNDFKAGPKCGVSSILAQSPYSAIEGDGTYTSKSAQHPKFLDLDYALLKLQESVGKGLFEVPELGNFRRGWLSLVDQEVNIDKSSKVYILQHPKGQTLNVASEAIATEQPRSKSRLRYLTETADGSSGSPCFRWSTPDESGKRTRKVVALHNYGDPGWEGQKSEFNHGIPIRHIVDDLRRKGIFLFHSPPPGNDPIIPGTYSTSSTETKHAQRATPDSPQFSMSNEPDATSDSNNIHSPPATTNNTRDRMVWLWFALLSLPIGLAYYYRCELNIGTSCVQVDLTSCYEKDRYYCAYYEEKDRKTTYPDGQLRPLGKTTLPQFKDLRPGVHLEAVSPVNLRKLAKLDSTLVKIAKTGECYEVAKLIKELTSDQLRNADSAGWLKVNPCGFRSAWFDSNALRKNLNQLRSNKSNKRRPARSKLAEDYQDAFAQAYINVLLDSLKDYKGQTTNDYRMHLGVVTALGAIESGWLATESQLALVKSWRGPERFKEEHYLQNLDKAIGGARLVVAK